jgi:hypothetical protein
LRREKYGLCRICGKEKSKKTKSALCKTHLVAKRGRSGLWRQRKQEQPSK